MVEDEFAHRHEGPHDLDAHIDGAFAAQHGGERGHALLGEGIWQIASQVAGGRYRILRYQLVDLASGELKHEVRRKAIGVPFYLLAQADGFDFKKHSQIAIKQDLRPAESENPLRNLMGSRCFDESHRLAFSRHGVFKN